MDTSVFVDTFILSRQDFYGTSNRSSHSFHRDANDEHFVVGIRCNLSFLPPPLIPLSPLKPGFLCCSEPNVTIPSFSSRLYCSVRTDPNLILLKTSGNITEQMWLKWISCRTSHTNSYAFAPRETGNLSHRVFQLLPGICLYNVQRYLAFHSWYLTVMFCDDPKGTGWSLTVQRGNSLEILELSTELTGGVPEYLHRHSGSWRCRKWVCSLHFLLKKS